MALLHVHMEAKQQVASQASPGETRRVGARPSQARRDETRRSQARPGQARPGEGEARARLG